MAFGGSFLREDEHLAEVARSNAKPEVYVALGEGEPRREKDTVIKD
jgi:hypothetical protein